MAFRTRAERPNSRVPTSSSFPASGTDDNGDAGAALRATDAALACIITGETTTDDAEVSTNDERAIFAIGGCGSSESA